MPERRAPKHLTGASKSVVMRDREAVELRARGLSYDEIARTMGCSLSVAHDRVRRGLARWAQPDVDQLFPLEMKRLDELQASAWDAAIRGDPEARAFVLRIMERRARLCGLDAPHRVDVRALIESWAEREGLDATLVLQVVPPLLGEL